MNLPITDSYASRVCPMPGYALLKILQADLTTPSGLLHLPALHTTRNEQAQPLRRAVVVRVNPEPHKYLEGAGGWVEEEIKSLVPGTQVLYLGHMDEMDNDYVLVLHGQILGAIGG